MTALAGLLSIATWSLASVVRGGAVVIGLGQLPTDGVEGLVETAEVADSVLVALDSLTGLVRKRSELVRSVNLDTLQIRGLSPKQRDSLIFAAYRAGVDAAKDSARISALRALPLSTSAGELVRAAEQLAGAERHMWDWLSTFLNWEREKRKPNRYEIDSLFGAHEQFSVALSGYEAAERLGYDIQRRQLRRVRSGLQWRQRRLLLAYLLLPATIGGLLLMVHYGRTGNWSLPDALGISKRPN